MSSRKSWIKLARLIDEQKWEKTKTHEFPEKIEPKIPVLFPEFTPHQKVSFILSMYMMRGEIAKVLPVQARTVTKHMGNALKKLPPDKRRKYKRLMELKKKHMNHWLVFSSLKQIGA